MKTDYKNQTQLHPFLLLAFAIALLWTIASVPLTSTASSPTDYQLLAEHENGFGNG